MMKRIGLVVGVIIGCFSFPSFAAVMNVPSEYATIQAAIDVSVDGDEVVIAPGTYTGVGNRDIDFKGKGITVRSIDSNDPNIAAATVIDCNGLITSPHIGFMIYSRNPAFYSIVDGLTIRRGYAAANSVGGAVGCSSGNIIIRNSIIENSNGGIGGGGIVCGNGAKVLVENCTIRANVTIRGGGGIYCFSGAELQLRNSRVINNSVSDGWPPFNGGGGGIYCNQGALTITNSSIANNTCVTGGGISLYKCTNVLIEKSSICGNKTIGTSSNRYGGGIAAEQSQLSIINCEISENEAWYRGGALYSNSSNITMENCSVENQKGSGVYCENGTAAINRCVFKGNRWNGNFANFQGFVVGLQNVSDAVITNSLFCDNVSDYAPVHSNLAAIGYNYSKVKTKNSTVANNTGYAFYISSTSSYNPVEINSCIVWGNAKGSFYQYFPMPGLSIFYSDIQPSQNYSSTWSVDLQFVDPNNANPNLRDYHLKPSSLCINKGDPNVIEPNETDLDGQPRVVRGRMDMGSYEVQEFPEPMQRLVPSDYPTIQAAIDASVIGDSVIIAPGVYTGSGNRDLDFRGKTITVRSTDPNNPDIVSSTIIDCNGRDADRHRGFLFHSGEGADSKVSGLTITRGWAPDVTVQFPRPYSIYMGSAGGAIACISSSPTLSRLMIVDNSVSWRSSGAGGGLFCASSTLVLEKCTIISNGINTMMYPIYGGGICALLSTITARECDIMHNGSVARSPQGAGGALYSVDGSVFLDNCAIVENAASAGGGIVFGIQQNNGVCSIINCTISGNEGGGIAIWSSALQGKITIHNSIVWGNDGIEITGQPYSQKPQLLCRYSNIKGGWAGEGNIDTDPCFVKAGCWDVNNTPSNPADDKWIQGDYHLRPESWCIDAGDPNFVCEPNETDLDGLPRIKGGLVDMGAYEFNDAPVANAGKDQTVYAQINEKAKVMLDGSGSGDADGDALTYQWTWAGGSASGISPTIELPVGVHTISLVVNDGTVDSLPDEVVVRVVGPVELLEELQKDLAAMNLDKGVLNGLAAKLDTALKKLADKNVKNNVAAVNTLQAFINAVNAQRGKNISQEQADFLVTAAQKIIGLLNI